jgi:hypothetical protein
MRKTQKSQVVKVDIKMNNEQLQKEMLEKTMQAIKKIDKGGKEHTKRYVHLYKGTLETLKALLNESEDLSYNTEKPKDVNNERIAKLVVKKGFALGYLVKFPNSTKASPYSHDTFQDVLRELFTDTRGRREGINELLGEDVGSIFLQCSAIAKQKYFREMTKAEVEALEGMTQNNIA